MQELKMEYFRMLTVQLQFCHYFELNCDKS